MLAFFLHYITASKINGPVGWLAGLLTHPPNPLKPQNSQLPFIL
jgi:hypothetical protein